MTDYISRSDAIRAVFFDALASARIQCVPAADVVEVVRCKNCENADSNGMGCCYVWCNEMQRAVSEDGWCYRGEDSEVLPMYEELVKDLRNVSKFNSLSYYKRDLINQAADAIEDLSKRPEIPATGIGDMSDGYHTFNGLYYQRMVLFSALVNAYQDRAWKSWKHEDGEPCFDGGWFIVGIDTPKGSYTYHYEDKYWNWFECKELPVAKHWDGHAEEDVTRLLTLPDQPRWIPVTERLPEGIDDVLVTDGSCYAVGYYRDDAQAWDSCEFGWLENRPEPPIGIGTVTHWMPLPEPPKDGE